MSGYKGNYSGYYLEWEDLGMEPPADGPAKPYRVPACTLALVFQDMDRAEDAKRAGTGNDQTKLIEGEIT